MDIRVSVLEQLRVARLRPTRQRVVVLQTLRAADGEPLAAEEVFRRLLQRGTPVSAGSVYRILHELERANLTMREWNMNRKSFYRLPFSEDAAPPLTLLCVDTGRYVVLEEPGLCRQLAEAARRHGVELRGQAVSIQCAGPRKQRAPRASDGRAAAAGLAATAV